MVLGKLHTRIGLTIQKQITRVIKRNQMVPVSKVANQDTHVGIVKVMIIGLMSVPSPVTTQLQPSFHVRKLDVRLSILALKATMSL